MTSTNYSPEIDGLRAVAVISVVLYHLGFDFPGGYVGVDIFFVISGFLITRILLKGIGTETFSLTEFWERRIRRIFPSLFCMCCAVYCLGLWILLPKDLIELAKSSIAQALLIANIFFWRDVGYFAESAELKPLLHTWSLAVEEQFYLFYPMLLFFLKRRAPTRFVVWLYLLSLCSFLISIYGVQYHRNAAFFLLPTRAWELLVGCILAASPARKHVSSRGLEATSLVGFFAILIPVFFYNSATLFPGFSALPPVLGTALIIFATSTNRPTLVGRLLSNKPMVFIGLISYSLYLWHWPVIALVRSYYGKLDIPQQVISIFLSLVISILSWKFIETPCRRESFLQPRRKLFSVSLLFIAALIVANLLVIRLSGFPSRFPASTADLVQDTNWKGSERALATDRDFVPANLPLLGKENSGTSIDFLFWGDSHGLVLADTLDELARNENLSGKAVLSFGNPPLPNCYRIDDLSSAADLYRFQNAVMKYIEVSQPRNIILAARWSLYTDGWTDADNSRRDLALSDRFPPLVSDDSAATIIQRNFQQFVEFCSERKIHLWVIKQVPETDLVSPSKDLLFWVIGRREHPPEASLSRDSHFARQGMPNQIFTLETPYVHYIDPSHAFFDTEGKLVTYQQGRSFYRDNDHLTQWGVEKTRDTLREMIKQIADTK